MAYYSRYNNVSYTQRRRQSHSKHQSNTYLSNDRIDNLTNEFSLFSIKNEFRAKYKETPNKGLYLYILLLEGDNYYVGITRNLKLRLGNHFARKGSEWTKLHKPLKLIYLKENIAPIEERDATLEYMKAYGWWRVRGASWTRVDMTYPPKELW